MEDSICSTNHKNNAYFSGDELEFSSENSSWSSYFNNSVSSSNVENTVTYFSSESSSIFSDTAPSVDKMNPSDDDHVASARSVAKRRKIRPTFLDHDHDHDLQDTATSPACNSQVQDMQQLHIKLQETSCGLNMLQAMQQGKQDCGRFFQVKQDITNQSGEVTHSGYNIKDVSYAGLKEKGLCLVPLSLLFQVW